MTTQANAKYGYRSHTYEVTPQGLRCAKCQRVKQTRCLSSQSPNPYRLSHLVQYMPQGERARKERLTWYEAV
jgi:hypothetical protein